MAFRRLCNKKEFRNWLKIESLHAEEISRRVDEAMDSENLSIEAFKDGKWAVDDEHNRQTK